MPDAMQIKEKIISLIRFKGPSLPVHVAKEVGLSILFASAFLSELFNEKRIMMSNLKVGSSSLYFISGQEPQLERFSQYLKSKEKEAFITLKDNKFLKDSELQPAIRVAIKEIKDFAISFKVEEEIYWRFFTVPEEEFKKPKKEIKEPVEVKMIEETKEIENIFEEPEETIKDSHKEEEPKTEHKKIPQKKKQENKKPKQNKNKKNDENFFNRIKETLSRKDIEILDIQDFKNNEAILKVKVDKKEELFFIFNTKKITEKEILKSHKKASEIGMKYSILFPGDVPKKMNDLITAIKDLSNIDKIE